MKGKLILSVLLVAALTGCAGIRQTNTSFVTHAEAFRIAGIAIPGDDQAAAMALVPKGAHIENISSTPADWTSFWGGLGNIIGFHFTEVGGTK